jgi:beta-ureidopropionase / N-carbamoyl-L-amino-acid hydrolase
MLIPAPDVALAEAFLNRLAAETADTPGVTRDAYGGGEERAHKIASEMATRAGLEVTRDFAANLHMVLPGADRSLPALYTGSHLDSVAHGGNLDGAAGVAAGLAVAAGFAKAGIAPPRDLVVLATRAEETVWFPVSFCGARAALGTLPMAALDTRRSDTSRTLAEHMIDCHADPQAIRQARRSIDPARARAFIELHIEQGPVLEGVNRAVGLVPAIAGGPRFREARILGEYAHVGSAPLASRRDAVAAFADLVSHLNEFWRELDQAGRHVLATFGVAQTDRAMHAWSKVAGRFDFTLDIRGTDLDALTAMRRRLAELVGDAATNWGVKVDLGPDTGPQPGFLDAALHARARAAASAVNVPVHVMPSGSGHDALAFHHAGIPTGFLFIRSQNGGHNPDEAMQNKDFEAACRVLAQLAMTL